MCLLASPTHFRSLVIVPLLAAMLAFPARAQTSSDPNSMGGGTGGGTGTKSTTTTTSPTTKPTTSPTTSTTTRQTTGQTTSPTTAPTTSKNKDCPGNAGKHGRHKGLVHNPNC